jgi:hypothetical protein
LLLLPIEPDANQSLGGVLLEQPSATHAKPLKISTPRSSYDLSWTAVMARILRVTSQLSTFSCISSPFNRVAAFTCDLPLPSRFRLVFKRRLPSRQITFAISRYRQNAFASMICCGVLHSTWNKAGLATSTATQRARDTATLSRFKL